MHQSKNRCYISESKLDETVLNREINIPWCNILRSARNRHGGGGLCYIKNTICYNRRESFSTEIENIFVDILLPKTKPILIGNAIFNTPNFDRQEDILGDLNINLNYTGRCVPNGVKNIDNFVHCTDSHSW